MGEWPYRWLIICWPVRTDRTADINVARKIREKKSDPMWHTHHHITRYIVSLHTLYGDVARPPLVSVRGEGSVCVWSHRLRWSDCMKSTCHCTRRVCVRMALRSELFPVYVIADFFPLHNTGTGTLHRQVTVHTPPQIYTAHPPNTTHCFTGAIQNTAP